MRNQCGIFYSLNQDYELKILCVSLKLTYLGILQKNMQSGDLCDLQYCWDKLFFQF